MEDHLLKDIQEKIGGVLDQLKTLNGKVAKHNEWINRYDIRVATEIPEIKITATKLEKKVNTNGKYIFGGTVILVVLQFAILVLIKFI